VEKLIPQWVPIEVISQVCPHTEEKEKDEDEEEEDGK
jgi:hypothetical protein